MGDGENGSGESAGFGGLGPTRTKGQGQQWVECWVPGRPRGKARPRARRQGDRVRLYSVREDVLVENWARTCWLQQVGAGLGQGGDGPVSGPVEVEAHVFLPCPASKPKGWREAALAGLIRPVVKPDTDNVAKLYLDGLNGVAWLDDAQVVDLVVRKWYGPEPGVRLRARGAGG